MECTHVLSLIMQDNCGIDEDLYKQPVVSSNCTTWLINVHPTWSEENILELLQLVPLDLQFCHMLSVEFPFYKGLFAEELVALFQVFLLSYYQALLPGLCFKVWYTEHSPSS